MKQLGLIAGATALSLGAGAPASAQNTKQVVTGTAIGAGAGAVAGALIPGLSTGGGALIGAGTGAAVTVLRHNKRHYRDNRGRRYHVNKHGYRVYD